MTTAIFDLDGTLLNTISDLGKACNYALSETGLPVHSLPEYRRMVGNGFRKLIERAAPEGTSSSEINRLIEISRNYYDTHCMETTTPYTGIPTLLDELSSRGIRIAVASNKYQSAVERIIHGYFPDIPFIAIEGQREERPVKPNPAVLEDIIRQNKLSREHTLMIGDSIVDIETARRAGIRSVAVTWGFSPKDDLAAASPDFIAETADEILKLF